jgi:hypothetical protein
VHIFTGRQLNVSNADEVEPTSAPTRIIAMSSSAPSRESEALGSDLSANILRPSHVIRQVSLSFYLFDGRMNLIGSHLGI